jgi:phosphatidylglycerophosphatase A
LGGWTQWVATGFGVGYLPVAPGTAGSLLGLAFYLLLRVFSPLVYGLVLLTVLLLGFYTAGRAEEAFQRIDPSQVVIDEIGGMLATYFLLPTGVLGVTLGFCFFRLFDVTKPPPIRWLQELPGGAGIMLDDLAAAGYAHLLTRWVLWWIG